MERQVIRLRRNTSRSKYQVQQANRKIYKFILVDEAQDLTPDILALLRQSPSTLPFAQTISSSSTMTAVRSIKFWGRYVFKSQMWH